MISERIDFGFDVRKLQAHLANVVQAFGPVMVGDSFGGWSVYSSNGSYLDGWGHGQLLYDESFMPGHSMEEKLKALGTKSSWEYVHETEICTGYLKEVMDVLKSHQLSPRRARLTLLKARGASSIHQDAPENVYSVRLHIPILTNAGCFFRCNGEEEHFPADGSGYFISVNRPHQVVNLGHEDRIHLIMDVTDVAKLTTYHQCPETYFT